MEEGQVPCPVAPCLMLEGSCLFPSSFADCSTLLSWLVPLPRISFPRQVSQGSGILNESQISLSTSHSLHAENVPPPPTPPPVSVAYLPSGGRFPNPFTRASFLHDLKPDA